MRAFISSGPRLLAVPRPPFQPELASMAEREARAILAESEPSHDAEGWVTAHVPTGFPEWGHAALAEALAAFVGEGN